ncbi:MAG: MMPL family transporter [Candidatus Omnitrophica bacterium]|nr:MMPL family transporter [Candidatus Omnitrophota bacterium]
MINRIVSFALRKPKTVFAVTGICVLVALALFVRVKIDTDPENMLPEKEFVRVFNHEVKKEFTIYDYIVLGVVNEKDPQGVFNPATLEKIYKITGQIKNIDGVMAYELMSLANKDDIEQAGPGTISFRWLMGNPPYSAADASRIKVRALDNPMFYDTLISRDAKALCIYVPIKEKKFSYRVAKSIQKILKKYPGVEQYHVTGLPLAEDAFGVEMFWQMGISAPLAVLVIFLLMWWFFRSLALVVMPLVMAMVVVVVTMGFMVGLGFPIHIMSSMIPIFLLPISVLDSIHILNEFFEKYRAFKDKNKTITYVLNELYRPNLFTSLTTVAGFFSLSFAPIPPVQVFGIAVAFGVALAWVLTVLLIPAYVALLDEKKMGDFGIHEDDLAQGFLSRALAAWGKFTVKRWKGVLVAAFILIVVAVYGITHIQINDNPTKWFNKNHPIRVADKVLNAHFGGTYSAYLVLEANDKEAQVFQEPEMLRYIEGLQRYLLEEGSVGKSTSLADITKKVYYELLGGDKTNNVIPPTPQAVAQALISFENSHKPDDLWHFVNPDYSKVNVWLQLTSGDNKQMTAVVKQVDRYLVSHPAPFKFSHHWAGLTYINMVWQDKMVVGMLVNFLGSFLIVLFMMIVLFKSPVTGLVSMLPLSITILFIYGTLGFTGKEYDMPVAVLSALTLGLAVDFAIHFIERARMLYAQNQSWPKTVEAMFGTPARALIKNALVISIGFLPLFASPLVPYNTVGFFMFMIMLVAGIVTLMFLPALITGFPRLIFEDSKVKTICSCSKCVVMSLIIASTVAYVLLGYELARINATTVICVAIVVILSAACALVSKQKICENRRIS